MVRPQTIVLTFLALIAFISLALGWELHTEAEMKKARGDFIAALERFEEKGQAPPEMERLPWAAQYMYLKSRVYPEREKELDKAGLAVGRMKSCAQRLIRPDRRTAAAEYVGVAERLLELTQEMWANEKAVDAAYFARDWDKRQKLALERSGLVERYQEQRGRERQKWKETGL